MGALQSIGLMVIDDIGWHYDSCHPEESFRGRMTKELMGGRFLLAQSVNDAPPPGQILRQAQNDMLRSA